MKQPSNTPLGELNGLLKTLKSFNSLISKAPNGVKVNIYIDILCIVAYIAFVALLKFVMYNQQLAHKGLALLCSTVIGFIVIMFFGVKCYRYHIHGANLD